jgi:hypothetical protein
VLGGDLFDHASRYGHHVSPQGIVLVTRRAPASEKTAAARKVA